MKSDETHENTLTFRDMRRIERGAFGYALGSLSPQPRNSKVESYRAKLVPLDTMLIWQAHLPHISIKLLSE